ncbi:hypothetical protein FIU90_00305 [Erythrobacter sp. THAF29]|nr:hypothetical protein FIU90_00305 [Erythrobacter sp. THAF29]
MATRSLPPPSPGIAPWHKLTAMFASMPKLIIPAVLFAYSCLLPAEFAFELGGVEMWPYRVVGIAMLPVVLLLAPSLPFRPSKLDLLAGFAVFWYFFSTIVLHGLDANMVVAIAITGDFVLAYSIGRLCIRGPTHFRMFLAAIIPGAAIAAGVVVIESIAGSLLLRPALATFLGQAFYMTPEFRFGLVRGLGPFNHPILAGVFLTSLLPLFWLAFRDRKMKIAGAAIAIAGFFTLSSTALLNLLAGGALLAGLYAQRAFKIPVFAISAIGIVLVYAFLTFASQSGALSVFSRYVLFNALSGQYRELIWKYATQEISEHPIFGIGQRDWNRAYWMFNDSLDSYWLEISMRYGLPLGIALLALTLGTAFSLVHSARTFRYVRDRDVHIAIAMSVLVIVFSGLSVHIWQNVGIWYQFLTGIGVSLSAAGYAGLESRPLLSQNAPARTDLEPQGKRLARPGSI